MPIIEAMALAKSLGGGLGTAASIMTSVSDIMAYSGPKNVLLDIGAHRGLVSSAGLVHGWREVVAVEPDPENIVAIKADFAMLLNGRIRPRPQARVIERAVSTESGKMVELRGVPNSYGQRSIVYRHHYAFPRVSDVETISFCALMDEVGDVDYCKIDVEGAEYLFLDGSKEAIDALRRVRYLNLELHGGLQWYSGTPLDGGEGRPPTHDALCHTLTGAGFDINPLADGYRGFRSDR